MKKLLVFFASTLCISIAAHPAAAATNGPVNMTVNSASYNVYYTTVAYQTIIDNYPGSISDTAKGSTTGLDGISSAAPKFQQPWFFTGNSTYAEQAALAWYNSSVWSTTPTGANDAVKLPNTSPYISSPYFVYGISNGSFAEYATVDSLGNVGYSNIDVSESATFALAGVSN